MRKRRLCSCMLALCILCVMQTSLLAEEELPQQI